MLSLGDQQGMECVTFDPTSDVTDQPDCNSDPKATDNPLKTLKNPYALNNAQVLPQIHSNGAGCRLFKARQGNLGQVRLVGNVWGRLGVTSGSLVLFSVI